MAERSLQQVYLLKTAGRLGIAVKDFWPLCHRDLVVYSYQGKEVSMLEGRYDARLTAQARLVADDKQLTKVLLQDQGYNVPPGFEFETTSKESLDKALSNLKDQPIVIKPLDGTEGQGVGIGLQTKEDITLHLATWSQHFDRWIVEAYVAGPDLRIQVIGGRLAAACVRRPAYVVGDGSSSLVSLIEAHRVKVARNNPTNRVDMDRETHRLLAQQRLSLDDIPPQGQEVILKETSNMSQGGIAIDVTDALHEGYQQWIEGISKAFRHGLELFAIDAICSDPSLPPEKATTVIEINPAPDWLHHTFSEVKTHDIPALILKSWFDLSEPV